MRDVYPCVNSDCVSYSVWSYSRNKKGQRVIVGPNHPICLMCTYFVRRDYYVANEKGKLYGRE